MAIEIVYFHVITCPNQDVPGTVAFAITLDVNGEQVDATVYKVKTTLGNFYSFVDSSSFDIFSGKVGLYLISM